MENIKVIENSNGIITLELSEGIKLKFILENFKKDGEMEIEYDEKLMDETTAAIKVDEYFSSLLDFMNTHEDIFKKDEK